MAKTNEEIDSLAKSQAKTAEAKALNAEQMITKFLNEDIPLGNRFDYEVFTKGSFASDLCIEDDSDVDIAVNLKSIAQIKTPSGYTMEHFGFTPVTSSSPTFQEFKEQVKKSLSRRFQPLDDRGKCLRTRGNTYRVNADIVPSQEYKHFLDGNDKSLKVEGTLLYDSYGKEIINYPKTDTKNIKEKDASCNKNYSAMVRLCKRVRKELDLDFPSYLIAGILYNVSNDFYLKYSGFLCINCDDVLKEAIRLCQSSPNSLTEMNRYKTLFDPPKKDPVKTIRNLELIIKYLKG